MSRVPGRSSGRPTTGGSSGSRRARLLAPLVGLGLLLGGIFAPGIALAHNVLVGSDPADGSSLAAGPAQITLKFDLPVQAGFNVVTVVGPDGGHYENGAPNTIGSTVTADVHPLGPAGKYTVGYRVRSADGHPVTGELTFTLTTAGTGSPASVDAARSPGGSSQASPQSSSTGVPIWVWIAGAVVLLAIGLTVALRSGGKIEEKN